MWGELGEGENMSKVGVVLNYWIFIIVVLLVAKVLNLAEDGNTILIVVVLSTAFYVLFMLYSKKRQNSRDGKHSQKVSGGKKK